LFSRPTPLEVLHIRIGWLFRLSGLEKGQSEMVSPTIIKDGSLLWRCVLRCRAWIRQRVTTFLCEAFSMCFLVLRSCHVCWISLTEAYAGSHCSRRPLRRPRIRHRLPRRCQHLSEEELSDFIAALRFGQYGCRCESCCVKEDLFQVAVSAFSKDLFRPTSQRWFVR